MTRLHVHWLLDHAQLAHRQTQLCGDTDKVYSSILLVSDVV